MNADNGRERLVHPDVDVVAATELWDEIDNAPEPEVSTAEILDRNYYETIAAYNPAARLPRHLALRLRGPMVRTGQIDIDIARDLFTAFEAELAAAARSQGITKPPRVELAGISPGSAVLHLTPAAGEEHPGPAQMQIVVDQLDDIVAKITGMHRVAEDQGDLRSYADDPGLLKGLRGLVSTLDRHNLDLDLIWRSGAGVHRSSALTARARSHVRSQWVDEPRSVEKPLTGMVVKLDLNGTFSLNTGTTGKRLYEIHVRDQARLLSLHLNLGDHISLLVEEKTRVNRVGLQTMPRYELVRILSRSAMVDEA